MTDQLPWEDEPLRAGAVCQTLGQMQDRVLLVGGGYFDVYNTGFGERDDYVHFSEMFRRQPEPQIPWIELLEVAFVETPAVRGFKPTGRVDELADQPPHPVIAEGMR